MAITVTDAVGVVKATAEVSTTSRPEWDGADGFQTASGDWSGGAPPDIQPGDIVIVWVDGGWTGAQVQIGDISGTIDLEADSIQGTIEVPWFPQGVEIDLECHPWGAAMPQEIMKYDTVLPDGEDTYNCSWVCEWDIQPGQVVGVGYFGPDHHWVANAFIVPTFVAYVPGAIEGYDWPMGHTITVNINDGEYVSKAVSEQRPGSPEGATRVLFEPWRDGFTIEAGDIIVMTDEATGFTKDVIVTNLAVTGFDLSAGTVSRTKSPGSTLR